MIKFLVIRLSSIGDIILTTPVIRCLKNQYKEAEIHFLVKREFLHVISANPYIDKIHCYDHDLRGTIRELRKENIHYIIDLHNNIRSFIIKARLHSKPYRVDKINFRKFLMVHFKINRLPDKHIVDRYLETVASFGIQNDAKGLDYFIPDKDTIDMESLPDGFSNGYIALVTGGKHITKQIPAESLILICRLLDSPVILLGGKDELETGNLIAKSAGNKIFNACGKYNINQSVYLVKHARLVITTDTGLMHAASAFQKIILSVWGNTIPEFGMSPYQPHPSSKIFEVKGLYCRPCSKIGFKKCPRGHFRCMMDQDFGDLAGSANSLLKTIH